jgi:hypothetical protein
MLWQLMFDEYVEKGGNLKHMSDMLIDLKYCKQICEDVTKTNTDEIIFGWCFHTCGSTRLYFEDDLATLFSNMSFSCKLEDDPTYIISVTKKGAAIVSSLELGEITEDGFRRKINA